MYLIGDCSLPKETGRCKALFERFFFNTESGKCEPFTYGGCMGNSNNFLTQDLCEQTCQVASVGRSNPKNSGKQALNVNLKKKI